MGCTRQGAQNKKANLFLVDSPPAIGTNESLNKPLFFFPKESWGEKEFALREAKFV